MMHRAWTSAVFFLMATIPLACGSYRMQAVDVGGTRHLFLSDVARFYGMSMRTGQKAVHLRSRSSKLRFTVHGRKATVNGVSVHLCHPVKTWRKRPVLSEDDFRLVMDPLLRHRGLPRRSIRRIVIDPGHGGKDPGAQGARHDEKKITFEIAVRLARLLHRYGYRVYLTRYGDTFIPLRKRPALAKKYRADLFLSLHANAVGDSSVAGVETFVLTPEGAPSTYGDERKDHTDAANVFDRENMRFGYELQKYTAHYGRSPDRGTKHANFAVLRDAPCTAALVEMGFITNPTEEKRLADPRHQHRVACGLARAIRAYHRAVVRRR